MANVKILITYDLKLLIEEKIKIQRCAIEKIKDDFCEPIIQQKMKGVSLFGFEIIKPKKREEIISSLLKNKDNITAIKFQAHYYFKSNDLIILERLLSIILNSIDLNITHITVNDIELKLLGYLN